MMRGSSVFSASSVSKLRPRALVALDGARAPGGRLWTSSTSEFQALHAVHWPAHLEWTAPQVWQMKAEPSRAMQSTFRRESDVRVLH